MIRFIRRLVLFAIAVVLVALIVANRHTTYLALDPFSTGAPAVTIEAPMFAFLFAALLAGVVLGGIGAWIGQGKWRELARQRTKEAHRLRRDRERVLRDMESARDVTARAASARLPST